MNSNEAVQKAIKSLREIEIAEDSKREGFESIISALYELSDSQNSINLVSYATKESYRTYNHAEDLKEDGAEQEDILYAEGEYEAFESFLSEFRKWLSKQDRQTIVKHSLNEELEISDEATLPSPRSTDERILRAISTHYLRDYTIDSEGNIADVMVETGKRKTTMSYDEFNKIFDIIYTTLKDFKEN